MFRAAEEAGQKSTESLRPYLANARSSTLAAQIYAVERQRALENKIEQQKRKLTKFEMLKPLVDSLDSGTDISEDVLRMLLKKMNKSELDSN